MMTAIVGIILFIMFLHRQQHHQASAAICNPDYEAGIPVGLCFDGSEVGSSQCCGQGDCSVRLGFCHCASGLWCKHDWHVIIFNEAGYNGRSGKWLVLREGNKCHNLPLGFNDSISSINTHGFCARLYDLPNCDGQAIDVQPGSNCLHRQLNDCNMNDKVSSIRSC